MTIPRMGLRHHRLVDKGLANVFRKLEEASKFANTLYPDNELDDRFQEVFIELVMKKLQKYIEETVEKVIKPGNSKTIFVDENKMRNRALNTMKLVNGEEIVAENFEEINRNVVKAEINVITFRNMIEQYQVLYRTIFDPYGINNEKFNKIMDEDYSVNRFIAGLTSNIRGAIIILEQNDIRSDLTKNIKENRRNLVDNMYFHNENGVN
jgi:hypothetical protein